MEPNKPNGLFAGIGKSDITPPPGYPSGMWMAQTHARSAGIHEGPDVCYVAPADYYRAPYPMEISNSPFGPKAAEVTGEFYRALSDKSYFQPKTPQVAAVSVNGTASN